MAGCVITKSFELEKETGKGGLECEAREAEEDEAVDEAVDDGLETLLSVCSTDLWRVTYRPGMRCFATR